jgi:hypothetical protein
MVSFLFVLFMAAVFTGLGWPLIRRLDGNGHLSSLETAVFAFAVGALFLYFGVFLIGPYRLDGLTMWSLAGFMTATAVFGWLKMPLWGGRTILIGLPTLVRNDPWAALLWIAIVLVGASSLIQGLAPPNDYDSIMYHLAVPQYDVERGFISIPWDRAMPTSLFPQFGGNITRFTLSTMNEGAAQMMHGLFGLLAAGATGLVMRRLGYGLELALLGALLFLVSRVVIWEMGTVETDVPLAAYAALAMLAYLNYREEVRIGFMVLFGLMIGSAILFKLLGFPLALAFAPLILNDLLNRKTPITHLLIGPLIALGIIIPHMIHTYDLSGNPIYPLFSSFWIPDALNAFDGVEKNFGTGRGIIDFILGPWTISILPMHYYDGMILGAPYILALAPLAFLKKGSFLTWRSILSFVLVYFVLWFWAFGQQVRFLLTLLPFLCGLAAVGLGVLWEMSSISRARRIAVISIVAVMGINQALFVGIYTLIRVPPAIGLIDAKTYHARTPSMTSSFYDTCLYVNENLKPDEIYLSLTGTFHSYYCPQAPVIRNFFPDEARWWLKTKKPPVMGVAEFITRSKELNFRYIIVSSSSEFRQDDTMQEAKYFKARVNIAAKPVILTTSTGSRFEEFLDPALAELDPVFSGKRTAIYDSQAVLEVLRRQHNL